MPRAVHRILRAQEYRPSELHRRNREADANTAHGSRHSRIGDNPDALATRIAAALGGAGYRKVELALPIGRQRDRGEVR